MPDEEKELLEGRKVGAIKGAHEHVPQSKEAEREKSCTLLSNDSIVQSWTQVRPTQAPPSRTGLLSHRWLGPSPQSPWLGTVPEEG